MDSSLISSLASGYEKLLRSAANFPGTHSCQEDVTADLDEITIQWHWLNRHFGKQFRDNLGRNVEIVHPGTWNRAEGPDFLNASIVIDGESIRGDIELDPEAADWERHGHADNANFNKVILQDRKSVV